MYRYVRAACASDGAGRGQGQARDDRALTPGLNFRSTTSLFPETLSGQTLAYFLENFQKFLTSYDHSLTLRLTLRSGR